MYHKKKKKKELTRHYCHLLNVIVNKKKNKKQKQSKNKNYKNIYKLHNAFIYVFPINNIYLSLQLSQLLSKKK